MAKKKKVYMPPDCTLFTREYDRALKLLDKKSDKKSSDFCDASELVRRATIEFEKCLQSDSEDPSGRQVMKYAEDTVDYAVRILELNNLYDQSIALREVTLTYLAKANTDGAANLSLINDAAMIGNTLLVRTTDGETPYPFSHIGKLFERLYKAEKIYKGGSLGGFIANLIVLAAVAGLICAIWLVEPVSALFSHTICGILSVLSAGALGVFVWKKYQEYLGYFSGCLGYILAGGLGMVIVATLLDKEISKAEASSAATVLAITAVAVVLMLTYWIPSFFGNLRYMLHIANVRDKYLGIKYETAEYIKDVRGALGKVKKLTLSDNPNFANTYGYVTRHFSVVDENGEKAADDVVWESFMHRLNAAEKYYNRAKEQEEKY